MNNVQKSILELKESPVGKLLVYPPLHPLHYNDCKQFRLAHLVVIGDFDKLLAIANHQTCRICSIWFSYHTKKGNIGKIHGLSMFHLERNSPQRKDYDKEFREAMKREGVEDKYIGE